MESLPTLGKPHPPLRARGLAALQHHTCRMAGQARRVLRLYSHGLDPRIYDRACFLEGVRNLVTGHARAVVEILVADPEEAARGHGLVHLARDLPSRVVLRVRPGELEGDTRSFLLADGSGLLFRALWSDPASLRVDYAAPGEVRRLTREFSEIWQRSASHPALRRLYL